MGNTAHREAVGRRLQIAMEALDVTQSDVAKLLGISLPKIGNWLRGDNYPDEYLLTVFCDRYGVTMDYLYRGVIAGLPGGLADGLASARVAGEVVKKVAASPARGRRKATLK